MQRIVQNTSQAQHHSGMFAVAACSSGTTAEAYSLPGAQAALHLRRPSAGASGQPGIEIRVPGQALPVRRAMKRREQDGTIHMTFRQCRGGRSAGVLLVGETRCTAYLDRLRRVCYLKHRHNDAVSGSLFAAEAGDLAGLWARNAALEEYGRCVRKHPPEAVHLCI